MTDDSKQLDINTKRKAVSSTHPAKRRQKRQSITNDESDSTETASDIDPSTWNQEFRQLEQVFRSLNTVYTFCCTRKHFPTTFENLKSSVENLTRRFDF
jgi:DEAD/DEAH box helicase domain-containing protein